MLAHVLDWQRVQLYTHFEEEVEPVIRVMHFASWSGAGPRERPWRIWSGRKEFYSLAFAVSPAVLIPRPESEFVVVEYLEQTRHLTAPARSTWGPARAAWRSRRHTTNPAVGLWRSIFPRRRLRDRPGATPQSSALLDRIDFRQGDLLEPVAGEGPFDAIISNPPYIASQAIEHLEPGVRDHEPRTALDGGPGGLDMVGRLIEQSVELLKPGGHLILEIGSDQEAPVRSLIEAQQRFRAGTDRFRPRPASASDPGDANRVRPASVRLPASSRSRSLRA